MVAGLCFLTVTGDSLEQSDLRRYILKKESVWNQTQVPWCAGGRAFRFFKACDFSLKSVGFCWETSISALATMSPDWPGGGKPEGPDGRRMRTVNTAAFPPEHGSIATGLGAPSTIGCSISVCSARESKATATEAKGRLAIC